jgi:hypothetical protein
MPAMRASFLLLVHVLSAGLDERPAAQALGLIMNNQSLFTRPADAGCHGLVLIHPTDADDRTEAATWMKVVERFESEISGREAPPDDHRQDEEVWSRMDDEGYPHERSEFCPMRRDADWFGVATQ